MAWHQEGDKPLPEPMMISLLMHNASLGLNELKRLLQLCWIVFRWTKRDCSDSPRLLCSPGMGAVGLSVGYKTWPPIDPSHRYGHPQAACREPAGSYGKTTRTAICFEHKTQYLLIRAPYTRIVVFWHISNIPSIISQSQISCNTPTFYIAAIFVKYCYTTGSWLL